MAIKTVKIRAEPKEKEAVRKIFIAQKKKIVNIEPVEFRLRNWNFFVPAKLDNSVL